MPEGGNGGLKWLDGSTGEAMEQGMEVTRDASDAERLSRSGNGADKAIGGVLPEPMQASAGKNSAVGGALQVLPWLGDGKRHGVSTPREESSECDFTANPEAITPTRSKAGGAQQM